MENKITTWDQFVDVAVMIHGAKLKTYSDGSNSVSTEDLSFYRDGQVWSEPLNSLLLDEVKPEQMLRLLEAFIQ